MKTRLFFLFLYMAAVSAWGQNGDTRTVRTVLSVEEIDQDGGRHAVPDGGTVDLNSVLLVSMDGTALSELCANVSAGSRTAELGRTMTDFSTILSDLGKTMAPLVESAAKYVATHSKADFDAYMNVRRESSGRVLGLMQSYPSEETRFGRRISAIIDTMMVRHSSYEEQISLVLDAIREEISALETDLNALLKEEGLYVQAGGWVSTAQAIIPVHLPGFDEIAEYPPNEAERFRLTLDAQGEAALARYDELAKQVNTLLGTGPSASALAAYAAERLRTAMVSISGIKAAAQDFLDSIQKAGADIADSAEALDFRKKLGEGTDLLTKIAQSYESLHRYLSGSAAGSAVELLVKFNTGVSDLSVKISDLGARIPALKESFGKLTQKAAQLKDSPILTDLTVVQERLAAAAAEILNISGISAVYSSGTAMSAELMNFSDKVRRLDPGNVPESCRLKLVTSGRQGAGDQVFIRAVIGRNGKTLVTAGEWSGTLERILGYVTTIPGMVLATPIDRADFQAAISYSVLFKGGIRNCVFWNSILTPGLGINVSGLDLNGDRATEIGLGLIFSFLRDILGAGIGYDFNTNQVYWFVSLNMPFTVFSLPLAGAGTAVP